MSDEIDLIDVEYSTSGNQSFLTTTIPGILSDRGFSTTELAQIDQLHGFILDMYIWIFQGTVVFFGIIFNILAIYALVRAKCNGTRYFLLQLTFSDIGTLLVCGLELYYMNYRKWLLPEELCPVYLGLEAYTNTATIYFLIAINLHALSTYNLAVKTIRKRNKNENEYTELTADHTDEDNDNEFVNDAMSTTNDNYEVAINLKKRSVTIDYTKKKTSVSVVLPALVVWLLSASVSVPTFVFGYVVPNEMNPLICAVVNFDDLNNRLMQAFILIVRVIIPGLSLLVSTVLVAARICSAARRIKPCGLDENVSQILRTALILATTFLIFSMQKLCASLLFEVISQPFVHYKYPRMDGLTGLLFSMLSFSLSTLRPILYYILDSGLRQAISFNQKRQCTRVSTILTTV